MGTENKWTRGYQRWSWRRDWLQRITREFLKSFNLFYAYWKTEDNPNNSHTLTPSFSYYEHLVLVWYKCHKSWSSIVHWSPHFTEFSFSLMSPFCSRILTRVAHSFELSRLLKFLLAVTIFQTFLFLMTVTVLRNRSGICRMSFS